MQRRRGSVVAVPPWLASRADRRRRRPEGVTSEARNQFLPARQKTKDPCCWAIELVQTCYNRRQVSDSDTSKRVCMYTQEQDHGLARILISRVTLLVVGATATFIPGWAAQGQTSSEPSSSIQQSDTPDPHTHMSEALRSSVKKVVVLPGASPADQAVTGTYEKDTPGLIGGIDAGRRAGTISKEVGGVLVNFPIPILTIPGAIVGGISGKTKRDIQEFPAAFGQFVYGPVGVALETETLQSRQRFRYPRVAVDWLPKTTRLSRLCRQRK